MTQEITRQIRLPVDDTFRPEYGDNTYPVLLGDSPFSDTRSNYRFLSKHYHKSHHDPSEGTFSEWRAVNNLCKVASTNIIRDFVNVSISRFISI